MCRGGGSGFEAVMARSYWQDLIGVVPVQGLSGCFAMP
jgi:hypothetical protein